MISDEAVARLQRMVALPDFTGTRYEIVREIGRGGMGVVYEAEDRELSRRVAIKVVAGKSAEAQLIATLEHPGIVPVHDAGTLPDGRAFYVMKLVRGETLAESERGAASSLRLFLRICEPVAFAHARGVVHCDLKPSNVMIGEFGEVLVMDWGIANRRGGTAGYIAPEQERGEITPAADVYALGTMLRHMAGERTPRRLRAIVEKATAAAKDERYPTARELSDDVSAYLDGRSISAFRETPLTRASRWISRNRALLAVIAAYLIMRAIVLLTFHR